MADVTVRIPGLLARFADGRTAVAVSAATVEESLDRLLERYPALEPHLFEPDRRRRAHLRLFHNGVDVDRAGGVGVGGGSDGDAPAGGDADGAGARPLADGDEVVVLQAVSGG